VTCGLGLNLDRAGIGSTITYAPIKGSLQTWRAAMALQATVPAVKVRWNGLEINYVPPDDLGCRERCLAWPPSLQEPRT